MFHFNIRLLVSSKPSRYEGLLAKENKAADLYLTSKTTETAEKRYKNYLLARAGRIKALALFHDFSFLYECLLDGFQAFDREGQLKDEKTVVRSTKLVAFYSYFFSSIRIPAY